MPQQKLTKKQNLVQAVKFLLFSISAGIIQAGTFALLTLVTDQYWVRYLPALILSVLWNFTLNREFTFKSAANVPVAMLKVTGYYAVFTPLSTWWGEALTGALFMQHLLPGQDLRQGVILFFTMVINLVTEFAFDRFVVFNQQINTNARGRKEAKKYGQG